MVAGHQQPNEWAFPAIKNAFFSPSKVFLICGRGITFPSFLITWAKFEVTLFIKLS